MGICEFKPAEELIMYDKHVIIDARDNARYERDEHEALEAMIACLDAHYTREAEESERFLERTRFDLRQESISGMFGASAHIMALGNVPKGYFDPDVVPDSYIVCGPLYMHRGCLHSKNLDASVIAVRNMLREKEKTEDLSPEEERIALEFHTHILTLSGVEPNHDHVD